MILPILLAIILSSVYIAALGFSKKETLKDGITEWPLVYIVGPAVFLWYSLHEGVKLSCSEDYRIYYASEELAAEAILEGQITDEEEEIDVK